MQLSINLYQYYNWHTRCNLPNLKILLHNSRKSLHNMLRVLQYHHVLFQLYQINPMCCRALLSFVIVCYYSITGCFCPMTRESFSYSIRSSGKYRSVVDASTTSTPFHFCFLSGRESSFMPTCSYFLLVGTNTL